MFVDQCGKDNVKGEFEITISLSYFKIAKPFNEHLHACRLWERLVAHCCRDGNSNLGNCDFSRSRDVECQRAVSSCTGILVLHKLQILSIDMPCGFC